MCSKKYLGPAFILLIFIELICARLAYFTLGEINEILFLFLILFQGIVMAAYLLGKRMRPIAWGIASIALLIIPYQLMLTTRWFLIQRDITEIIGYIYEQRLETGEYPADLSAYPNQDMLQSYVRYTRYDEGNDEVNQTYFIVSHYIGTETTQHWYDSRTQSWEYYPD